MIPFFHGIFAVYYREMVLYRKKMTRKGQIFASLVTPIIYLLAFGLGLGGRVRMDNGTYLSYLLPGLVAMSSMNNSFSWLATGLNLSIRTHRTFQNILQAPISPLQIVIGEVAAGMTRGLILSGLLIGVGFVLSPEFSVGWLFVFIWVLNTFLFANLGIIIAFHSRNHEEAGAYSNLLLMPMTFFSGTFFPLDKTPKIVQWLMQVAPLTHTNYLMRHDHITTDVLTHLAAMVTFSIFFFLFAYRKVDTYSE